MHKITYWWFGEVWYPFKTRMDCLMTLGLQVPSTEMVLGRTLVSLGKLGYSKTWLLQSPFFKTTLSGTDNLQLKCTWNKQPLVKWTSNHSCSITNANFTGYEWPFTLKSATTWVSCKKQMFLGWVSVFFKNHLTLVVNNLYSTSIQLFPQTKWGMHTMIWHVW